MDCIEIAIGTQLKDVFEAQFVHVKSLCLYVFASYSTLSSPSRQANDLWEAFSTYS